MNDLENNVQDVKNETKEKGLKINWDIILKFAGIIVPVVTSIITTKSQIKAMQIENDARFKMFEALVAFETDNVYTTQASAALAKDLLR